jgi:hypothetical protein
VSDKLINNAIDLCRQEYDTVRISTMQRRFALGYVAASHLIEELIRRGVIERVGNGIDYTVLKPSNAQGGAK